MSDDMSETKKQKIDIEMRAQAQWAEICFIMKNWEYPEKIQLNNINAETDNLAELQRREQLLDRINASVIYSEIEKQRRSPGLSLSHKKLTRFPSILFTLEELKAYWGSLKTLNLSFNEVKQLPHEIGTLTGLIMLWLNANQLTGLPPGIGNSTALTKLWLGGNRLTELPPEIGYLTALTMLGLSANQLTQLPAEMRNLTMLTTLGLSFNQLTERELLPYQSILFNGFQHTLASQTAPAVDAVPSSRLRL